uniref:Synenkephalin n=1 Tax=Eptatretus burgeri TaxID=7764 RepID=A0A8C4X160_EPTBU
MDSDHRDDSIFNQCCVSLRILERSYHFLDHDNLCDYHLCNPNYLNRCTSECVTEGGIGKYWPTCQMHLLGALEDGGASGPQWEILTKRGDNTRALSHQAFSGYPSTQQNKDYGVFFQHYSYLPHEVMEKVRTITGRGANEVKDEEGGEGRADNEKEDEKLFQKRYGGFMRRVGGPLRAWGDQKRYGGFMRRFFGVAVRSEDDEDSLRPKEEMKENKYGGFMRS